MALDFSTLGFNASETEMLRDATQAITKADMWVWMRGDPGTWGYYMSPAPEMREIRKHMMYTHNGSTFGATMTEMRKLAIMGADEYSASRLCDCRRISRGIAMGRNYTGPGRDWAKHPCSCSI